MSINDDDIVYGTEDLLTSLCNSVTRVLGIATQSKVHYSAMVQRIMRGGCMHYVGTIHEYTVFNEIEENRSNLIDHRLQLHHSKLDA